MAAATNSAPLASIRLITGGLPERLPLWLVGWSCFYAAGTAREFASPVRQGGDTFTVMTFNSWVGDYRRGFCSRDHERHGWIENRLRAADPDVLCLQEVLESEMETWCVCSRCARGARGRGGEWAGGVLEEREGGGVSVQAVCSTSERVAG